MFDNRVTDMMKEMEMRLRQQGLDMNLYMQYTGMTEDTLREQYADEAEQAGKVKTCPLEKISEIEAFDITATDEAEDEFKKLSEMYKIDLEKVKELIPEEDINKRYLVADKAMNLVKETANIKSKAIFEVLTSRWVRRG